MTSELCLVQGSASLLKKVMHAIEELINDADLECSAGGLSIQAMASGHVTLVSLLLRSEGFEHYRCDRNLSLGMNMKRISQILGCFGDDDFITIKANEGSDTVQLKIESPTQDYISNFKMELMDIDREHLGLPEAEYNAMVRMPSALFIRCCKNLSSIGRDPVSVTMEDLEFSAKYDDGRDVVVGWELNAVDEMKEPVSLTLPLSYLSSLAKVTPSSNTVTMSLSNDLQVLVEFKIAETGYVRFYLVC